MRHVATIVLSAFWVVSSARAQFILAPRPGPVTPPRPAGVFVPIPPPVPVPHALPFGPRVKYAAAWYGGPYLPFDPAWEPPAPIIVNHYIPVPVLTTPAPPIVVEKKARLLLNLPPRSEVWVNDQRVDSSAQPLIIESPDLQRSQRYTFALKVVWLEGTQREERTRSITVDVGEQKSLTYFATK